VTIFMKPPSEKISQLKPHYAWIIALSIMLIFLIISGIELFVSYNTAIQKASEQIQATSFLTAEWLGTSFDTPRYILKDVSNEINPAEIQYPSDNPYQHLERTNHIIRKAQTNSNVLFLGIFDKECTITHTSIGSNLGQNFKDFEYCSLVFQEPIEVFKMSNMFVSTTNKMNVTMSYPVIAPDGEMAGFVLAGLDLSFFQQWLDRLDKAAGMVVSIFDVNQSLIARTPFIANAIGNRLDDPIFYQFATSSDTSTLTFRVTSPIDGINRMWTFRRVQDQPFIVVSGVSTQKTLSAWRVKLVVYLIGNFLLIAITLFAVQKFNYSQQLAKSMENLANTDLLTGLTNRRSFIEMLQRRIEEADRYKQTFSIIMCDIDHFKLVNDSHGHDVGDLVLVAFAEIAQSEMRTSDTVARWGGEEFIVLLPHTNQHMGFELGERLRKILAETPIHSTIRISVSLGVSEYQEHDNGNTLIKRADDALYRAKNQGRNRTEIAT